MTIWRASLDKAECQQLLDVGVQVFIAVFFSTTVFCHKKKKKAGDNSSTTKDPYSLVKDEAADVHLFVRACCFLMTNKSCRHPNVSGP